MQPLLLLLVLGAAPPPEEIVRRMTERTALGFDAGSARLAMVLEAQAGGATVRRRLATRAVTEGKLKRWVVRFLEPADVEGTALLYRENAGEADDDVYLYLPSFKRTRRIAGAQKRGAFMGSDFTYADMENRDVKAATYQALPDAVVDGVDCWHLVATPRADQLYGKVELWVRKDSFLAQQIKFFDRKGAFHKAYRLLEARRVDGRWVAARSHMWTRQTGHSTYLEVEALDPRSRPAAAELLPEGLGR